MSIPLGKSSMVSTVALLGIFVFVLSAQASQGLAIPAVVYGATKPGNIKGDVLVLDVSSLFYQGNHPMGPSMRDSALCKGHCDQTIGCNAWTFCNNAAGCGSGCDAYVKANPKLQASSGNSFEPAPSWYGMAAIKSFGPWGSTQDCMAGGRWPYGMCSLKKLANPTKQEYWSTHAAEGWVSGHIVVPSQCGSSISARACQRCITSKSPEPCLACAKSPQLKARMLDSVQGGVYALSPADGCATCYNSAGTDKCTACLYGKKQCAECALQTVGDPKAKMDVASCIDCSSKYGASFSSACLGCAGLAAQPANVQRCMGCIARIGQAAATGSCSVCAASAAHEGCVSCLERKPVSESCASCALIADVTKQAKCYSCTKAAGLTGAMCSDCVNSFQDAKAVDQCIQCATNTKASTEGRQWCMGCQNTCQVQCLPGNEAGQLSAGLRMPIKV